MKIKSILSLFITIPCIVLGTIFGDKVDLVNSFSAIKELLTISSIIFAIVGIWIAVIYPVSLKKLLEGTVDTEKEDLRIRVLLESLKISFIVISLILVSFPIELLISSGTIDFLSSENLNRIFFGFFTFLLSLELIALLLSIAPVAWFNDKINQIDWVNQKKSIFNRDADKSIEKHKEHY